MSTATAPAAPTLNSVAKQVEEMAGVVKALAERPDSKVFYNEDGQPVGAGEWSDAGETLDLVVASQAGRGVENASFKTARKRSTPKALYRQYGYKGWGGTPGGFKSAADFIRYGCENANNPGAIEKKLGEHMQPITKAVQGMNLQDGSAGGFTVMPEFSNQIIDRVFSNNLLSRTDGYTVSGNNMTFLANAETSRANGSRHGGVQGYWMDEAGTIQKSKPSFRQISLRLVKLAIVIYFTDDLLSDTATALESYATGKGADEFNFMIGDGIWNGSGVGQPLGILKCPSLISIAKETGQLADTIQTENVEKMYSRFFAPNLGNAIWYHNQDIRPQLDMMTLGVGTGGVPTFLPPGGLSQAPYGMLKGRPLEPIEFAPTLGDQGDLTLADLKQLLSITKGGIAQAVSTHIEFLTGQTAIRLTMRLNIGPWENAPLTPYKGPANTQSSFVTLDDRA